MYLPYLSLLSKQALQAKAKKHGALKPGVCFVGSESFVLRAVGKRHCHANIRPEYEVICSTGTPENPRQVDEP